MPRIARAVIPGCPHHVTQRGNNRQDVFFVDDDRRFYLETLLQESARFDLSIEGYCLMTNHVHLIATPRRPASLAQALGRTHWKYSRYVNRLHGRCGHLWQNRFFSCALDDEHFWTALCYVELNPVRAKLGRLAWSYAWSSAAAHCRGHDPMLDLARWRGMVAGRDWRETLRNGLEPGEVKELRAATATGRPLGGDKWVAKLEVALGRRLRPLPVGRPTKQKR